ncbi:tbc1 domain family member gtpase-activating protein [Anaeramoeba flamelloides]|uniref:Tbc1 domain family member gtpase-activating protein n=1 Tax=Anaeramoeba flamelloides TaxID=1746091 RepID=A0ABQ8XWK2_9EUKA|nr:tbc1 domain family member gtpase-activating protein [Anaeramoeba flamelloides]
MKEFTKTISLPFSLQKLKKKIQQGKYQQTKIRSVIWRICLGCFSEEPNPKEFCDLIRIHRKRYSILKKNYLPTKKEHEKDNLNDNQNQNQNKSINKEGNQNQNEKRNKDQEEEYDFSRIILLDLHRTNSDDELFQNSETKQLLFNILFIFSKEQPDIGYKQGMNDLLANIFFVVYKEYKKNEKNDCYSILIDNNFIEADCYLIFEHVMAKCRIVYLSAKQDKNETVQNKNQNKTEKGKGNGKENKNKTKNNQTKIKNKFKTKPKQKPKPRKPQKSISKIIEYCRQMQNVYLKQYDEELYRHFRLLSLEPQLYCFRWFRLLLSREFAVDKILILWDYIFSDHRPLEFVSYFIVAMLILTRDQLFDGITKVLENLFAYSYNGNFLDIIDIAKNIRTPDGETIKMIIEIKKRKANPFSINVVDSIHIIHRPQTVNSRNRWVKMNVKPRKKVTKTKNKKIKMINKNQIKNYFIVKQHQKKISKLLNEKKLLLRKILEREENTKILAYCLEKPIKNIQRVIFNNTYHSEEVQQKLYQPICDLKNVKNVLLNELSISDLRDTNESNDKELSKNERNLDNQKANTTTNEFSNKEKVLLEKNSNKIDNKGFTTQNNIPMKNYQLSNNETNHYHNQNKSKTILNNQPITIDAFTRNRDFNLKQKIFITEDEECDLFTKTNLKNFYSYNLNYNQLNSFCVTNKYQHLLLGFKNSPKNNSILK